MEKENQEITEQENELSVEELENASGARVRMIQD